MMTDKQSSTGSEKKRSKSPSSLLEFAQRRLPKWASFIKKSDDDTNNRPESSNSTKQTINIQPTPEKPKSPEMIEPVASTSRSNFKEVDIKDPKSGECRWFVSDDEQNQSKSESSVYVQGHKLTKAHSFEPKGQYANENLQPATKSYSFSLFKGKECRESGKDPKYKGKSLKGSQAGSKSSGSKSKKSSEPTVPVKDVLQVETDNRSKSASPVENKPSSMKEKAKYFSKQKSKDKSGEPVRKNSITFGGLREKYNNWSKGGCSSKDKASSNENAERARMDSPAGRSHGEFLVASMRIFLVVSPPATRTQVRSRSLNNLDIIQAHGSRLAVPLAPGLSLARKIDCRFFSSTPELNAINYSWEMPYSIGVTRGKSAFVRCSRNQLRHTYSQGSTRDFFKLSLPSLLDDSVSFDDTTSESRRHMKNSVFVPALGGTSLRNAARWGSYCGPLMSEASGSNFGSDYTVTLQDSGASLPLDNTDAALLAGKKVKLRHEQYKPGFFHKGFLQKTEASRVFSTSTDESYGRWYSGGAGGYDGRAESESWPTEKHEVKFAGFSQKLNQTWISIFGSRSDSGKMVKLVKTLNELTKEGVPLLPGFQRGPLGESAQKALKFVPETKLEWIFDTTKLSVKELKRQRVIMELITTEASFIGYMRAVVEIFYSVAHILQQDGILTDIDNRRIFYNIPDILNVNISFWRHTIYPMLEDAIARKQRFNTQFMYKGFYCFRDQFYPYALYVQEQKKIQKYSKEKMETCEVYNAFLKWCESHSECKRLKLSDILVKPMQRLTKYTLLLNAIYLLTDYEPEKRTMKIMCRNTKRYIYEINTAIRYREESEILTRIVESIESYDAVEVRDEEIDRLLKKHSSLDLRGKMIGCDPSHRRTLILEGDIKFKDHKDMEVRAFLLTDMLLIALVSKKKKGNQPATYRIIRQKYMVDKLRVYPQYHIRDGVREITSLICIVIDETGTATSYFTLQDVSSNREGNPTLKRWEFAIREAQATLELARNLFRQPRNENWTDNDSLSDNETAGRRGDMTTVEIALERAARRRVATMVHGARSVDTDNTEGGASASAGRTGRGVSRASSRASRLSSLQQSYSGSYETSEWAGQRRGFGSADTSTDRRTTSVSSDESVPLPLSLPPMDYQQTVDMVNKMRSRSPSQRGQRQVTPPRIGSEVHPQSSIGSAIAMGLQHPLGNVTLTSNTLTVQSPHSMSIMQSLPNLTSGQMSPAITTIAPQVSLNVPQGVPRDRSRQIYVRTGLPAGALTPDSRGTSYPPPSPTRASLRRGFAFSSTTKNPPLSKTKNVSREPVYSSYIFTPTPPSKIDTKGINKGASTSRGTGSSSPLETYNVNVRGPNYLNIPSGCPVEHDVDESSRQQMPQLQVEQEPLPQPMQQPLPEVLIEQRPLPEVQVEGEQEPQIRENQPRQQE